ncbi:hypothetical protein M413DRAFT_129190 [Hebeloma cylindrosporum]|uniref:Uncharacterized protein n=1 Tax=Hebeloma cylindrosporum TaxID=76867 RepID=A0A0C3CDB1_HEBCY|nr:hypothetical protein M413DRAFT_129190 [Hebeloma cylindrosporum h7]
MQTACQRPTKHPTSTTASHQPATPRKKDSPRQINRRRSKAHAHPASTAARSQDAIIHKQNTNNNHIQKNQQPKQAR